MVKTKSRRGSVPYITPSPSPSPSPSPRALSPETQPVSVFSAEWDLEAAIMANSRPQSAAALSSNTSIPAPSPPAASIPTMPTLADILANNSPVPWTLAAFMGYLSQNHCMETLEFTMDAQRYRTSHSQVVAERRDSRSTEGNDYLCSLWEKLMQAYIIPCAPREVNLPSYVRDRLLSLSPAPVPPEPFELDEAVDIVYELMNDSVLLPFLESLTVPTPDSASISEAPSETRSTRTILRIPKHKPSGSSGSSTSSSSTSSHSAKLFLPHHHQHHQHQHHHHHLHLWTSNDNPTDSTGSPEMPERELFTDDSTSVGSPHSVELMSPPMTPPTPESPSTGFQRVMAAHSSAAWKKVKQLGFKKKPKSGSMTSIASFSGDDLAMPDISNSPLEVAPFEGTPYDGVPHTVSCNGPQSSHLPQNSHCDRF